MDQEIVLYAAQLVKKTVSHTYPEPAKSGQKYNKGTFTGSWTYALGCFLSPHISAHINVFALITLPLPIVDYKKIAFHSTMKTEILYLLRIDSRIYISCNWVFYDSIDLHFLKLNGVT